MRHILQAILITLVAGAQAQTIGSVATQDANVTGSSGKMVAATRDRFNLDGSDTIVARDHSAAISLARGGTVLLCRTSSLHLAGSNATLTLGLDRGAMEIRTRASATDVVLTPDLRLTMPSGGPLDLRLRVSTNGDTCVENRGRKAPVLQLTDTFGQARYLLRPGQHVLFEHGSLREVVDHETTPCGCLAEGPQPQPLNQAQLTGTSVVSPAQAAAANPFPAAQSAGLAPAPPLPADKPGETNTQVSTTFAVNPVKAASPAVSPTNPAAPPPGSRNPFRAIGRFFRRLFVR